MGWNNPGRTNIQTSVIGFLVALASLTSAAAAEVRQEEGASSQLKVFEPAAPTPAPSPQAILSYVASRLAADPVRPRVYATLSDANSVLVIDTNTLTVIRTIPIGSIPRGLALSADNSKLWVANSGSTNFAIGVIDLESLTALPSLPAPTQPSDIVEGLNHRLYVAPAQQNFTYRIMQIDSDTSQYQGSLGGSEVYGGGNLGITPDLKTLLFGNSGLSPSTLDRFDISTANAALLQTTNNVGSNGNSLTVNHSGTSFVFPNGGGNGGGYVTYEIPTININSINCSFNTGAYPGPAAFSNDDTLIYHGAFGTSRVSTYETCFCTLLGTFNVSSNDITDVVVDNSGKWLFVSSRSTSTPATGDIRVYSTGRTDAVRPFAKSAVSRKTHAGGATYEVDLPTACTRGVEDRSEAPLGTHHIVFRFAGAVTVNGASVIPAAGHTAEVDGAPEISADGTEVTVNLKNVSNAQLITVVLNGVNNGILTGDVPLTLGILAGDTNGDGIVNSADIAQTKGRSGMPLTNAIFRGDVNDDGLINSADIALVKSRSGTGL